MGVSDSVYAGYGPLLVNVAQDLRLASDLFASQRAFSSRETVEAIEKGVVGVRKALSSPEAVDGQGAEAKLRQVVGNLPRDLSCVCGLIGGLPSYEEIKDKPIAQIRRDSASLAFGALRDETTPAQLMTRLGGYLEGCLNRNTVCLRWGRQDSSAPAPV